jgi:hypothetical protein
MNPFDGIKRIVCKDAGEVIGVEMNPFDGDERNFHSEHEA